jgi:prepilin-type N-terminal cleavage/methylation domain-containing protein/prepilin-type processing-associated H-X9-DG protein
MASRSYRRDAKLPRASNPHGFTLVELMVVIAVAAVVAFAAVPMRSENPQKKRAIVCLFNCRQLAMGYLMYASDNHDIALASATNTNGVPIWVPGNVAVLPDAVDEGLIRNSPVFHYLGKPDIFRCPSDNSAFVKDGQLVLRNRSYSLNAFMGPTANPAVGRSRDMFRPAATLSQLSAPGPSAVVLFVDEHENSIDDGQFLPFEDFHRYGNQEWLSCPAGRHQNATGLAFADGHAELHKWQDSVVTPVHLGPPPEHGAFPRHGGPADFAWWTNHIAAFR